MRDRLNTLRAAIETLARPLQGTSEDHDAILDLVGDARVVLLGEASHGTHEFYFERAEITKRLIEELDVSAVAVEGDWPDAYRVNRYVQGRGADTDPASALADFRRFPAWLWRNVEVLDFVGWLRAHNDRVGGDRRVGFYGLDLYSLHASIESVLSYLDRIDPAIAARARHRYGCFEVFGDDPQTYGHTVTLDPSQTCEDEVVAQLVELQRRRDQFLRRDGFIAQDEFFFAEQNARVVKNAEAYYREMYHGRVSSWNLRDTHMADTLDALLGHLDQRVGRAKVVVWAHNSHVGDARATELGAAGELNVAQLARQRYGKQAVIIGFSTHSGTVTAANDWGEPAQRMRVRPGLPGSYEALFHAVGIPRFWIALRDGGDPVAALREPRLQRAIGVIYRPATERQSHYFRARLADQFDAVLHFDETRATEPLERTAEWERGEAPETYPTGL